MKQKAVDRRRRNNRIVGWVLCAVAGLGITATAWGLGTRLHAEEKKEMKNLIYGKHATVDASGLGFDDYEEATPEYYAGLTDIDVKPHGWFLSKHNDSNRFNVRFQYDLGGEYAVSEWAYKAMAGSSTRKTRSLTAKEIAFEISMDGETWQTVDYVRDNVEHDLKRPLQRAYKAKYVGFRFVKGSCSVERFVTANPLLMISELEAMGYKAEEPLPEQEIAQGSLEGIKTDNGRYIVYGKVTGANLSEVVEYGLKFAYYVHGSLYVETVALHSELKENGAYAVTIRDLPAGDYEAYTFARVGNIEIYSPAVALNV